MHSLSGGRRVGTQARMQRHGDLAGLGRRIRFRQQLPECTALREQIARHGKTEVRGARSARLRRPTSKFNAMLWAQTAWTGRRQAGCHNHQGNRHVHECRRFLHDLPRARHQTVGCNDGPVTSQVLGIKTGWFIEFIAEIKPLQKQVHATQIIIVAEWDPRSHQSIHAR
jgi:hypothetical protein